MTCNPNSIFLWYYEFISEWCFLTQFCWTHFFRAWLFYSLLHGWFVMYISPLPHSFLCNSTFSWAIWENLNPTKPNRAFSRHWGRFLGHICLKKGICLLVLAKQMSFSTISNKNDFSKTWGTKLGVIIAPNRVGPTTYITGKSWS